MKTALHETGQPRSRAHTYGRTAVVATVSAVLGATSLLAIPAANAAVPVFPDNLVVFPDRDFVTIEGYQERVGQTATVEVSRPGAGIIGSAKSLVSAGDVAFEINHPGGVCWGAETTLNVTPDIKPGDTVTIKFDGEEAGATEVQDTFVTEKPTRNGNTVIVTGHVGSGVNRDQMEQRVIDPALKDTSVGRRDVRAAPGPLTQEEGYQSSLEFSGDTFTATYIFDELAAAELVENAGGPRSMAWEEQDADANRQGLTIAEFGELGGPGMGGCPNGPLQSGPAGPTSISAAKVEGALKVNWTPAQAVPGTPEITGYRVTAVAKTITSTPTGTEQVESGVRISGQKASSTTIKGLLPDTEYDVYVASVSKVGETFPAIHAPAQTDTTPPTVNASPAGGTFSTAQQVILTASELGSDIYYTTDGTAPVSADMSTAGATVYTGPFTVSENKTVTFAAIDPSGNVSDKGEVAFIITNDPVPAAPTFTTAPKAGLGTAEISWTAPDAGAEGLTIEGYSVQAYTTDGVAFGEPKEVAGNVTTLVYDGLTGDTAYQFTVKATNENGTGAESAKSAPVTVQGALVANAGPDQSVNRAPSATTVTLDGTGSTTDATYQWEQVLTGTTDPDKVIITGGTTLKPTFSLPVFKSPMTNKPLTFRLTVTAPDGSTKTDEVKVTPVPDRVTISLAQWKTGDLRIGGTSNVVGGTITIRSGSPTGTILGTVPVTAAVAPETGGVYTLRLRNGAAGTRNPGTVYIESSVGGTAGPTTVANR